MCSTWLVVQQHNYYYYNRKQPAAQYTKVMAASLVQLRHRPVVPWSTRQPDRERPMSFDKVKTLDTHLLHGLSSAASTAEVGRAPVLCAL